MIAAPVSLNDNNHIPISARPPKQSSSERPDSSAI
jgi:hypothetical protein